MIKNRKLDEAFKNNYKKEEQLVLIMCRSDYDYELNEYTNKILEDIYLDWEKITGILIHNRILGICYKNLGECKKVPDEIMKSFIALYHVQTERNNIHLKEINKVSMELEKNNIKHCFLKGAVLNLMVYGMGQRISNDTDILVDVEDLDRCGLILEKMGYIQGEVEHNNIIPASKKEKIFARINTYEIVPFQKYIDNPYMKVHTVDINFRLSNDDTFENSKELLENSVFIEKECNKIRTMSLEQFFIFLCIHLYREAIMVYKIVEGNDLSIYKFADIHHLFIKYRNKIEYKKIFTISNKMNRLNDVYYTMFYTEKLFPATFGKDILNIFKPENDKFLQKYKGKDNSDEVYTWNMNFEKRVFNHTRKQEALKNIQEESQRFTTIKNNLKMV